jgi:hypothetical protein
MSDALKEYLVEFGHTTVITDPPKGRLFLFVPPGHSLTETVRNFIAYKADDVGQPVRFVTIYSFPVPGSRN